MNIWIVNHYAITPLDGGSSRHYSLAKELTKLGHDVTIIASSFNHYIRRESRLEPTQSWKLETLGGVRFLWLRTPPYSGNTIGRMKNMLTFAAKIAFATPLAYIDPPDVVVGSSPHLFAAWGAKSLARRIGKPFVLEVRDLWPETLIQLGRMSRQHPLIQVMLFLEKRLYVGSDRIITLLPESISYLAARGADRAKIAWIPNGVEVDSLPPLSEPPRQRVFTLMYAGAHGLANGLDSILDAAKILMKRGNADKVRFRIIGEGPEKERLKARARNEQIDVVGFEDPIPKSEIFLTLMEADAFVATLRNQPLYQWGISLNKIYDYLAAGRPVVFGAHAPGNPVALANAGLVVPPEDAEAMATAIEKLMNTPPEELEAYGRRGRQFIEQSYGFDRLGNVLEDLLLQALRRSRTRPRPPLA